MPIDLFAGLPVGIDAALGQSTGARYKPFRRAHAIELLHVKKRESEEKRPADQLEREREDSCGPRRQ